MVSIVKTIKYRCWSLNSNTLASWWEELTHWKTLWCWEGLKAGGEGDNRGWDGWMASPTWWTWVWVTFRSWWWTERPGMLQSMELQRVRHNWVTELNWIIKESWNKKEPQRSLRSKSQLGQESLIPISKTKQSSQGLSALIKCIFTWFLLLPRSLSWIGQLFTCPPTYHPFDPLIFCWMLLVILQYWNKPMPPFFTSWVLSEKCSQLCWSLLLNGFQPWFER